MSCWDRRPTGRRGGRGSSREGRATKVLPVVAIVQFGHLLSWSCHNSHVRFQESLPSLECGWWWLRLRQGVFPHRCLTSGSANVVLSMGGRLGVVQNSVVRTFRQDAWRVYVALWRCAASDHCIRKPFFCLPSCTGV